MRWSLRKALLRTGIPALVMFFGTTVVDLVRGEPDESVQSIVEGNLLGYATVWLAVALLVWAATHIFGCRPEKR
ncbi:MAG: hypothetical protein R6X25_12265 [Candidatus Krumholzibacteriia bacterium]